MPMNYRTSSLGTYLIDAATMADNDRLYVKPDRNITVAEMQAALNAQYGKTYKVSSHGSARYVTKYSRGLDGPWDGSPEVNLCEANLDGSYVHPKSSNPATV